MRRSRLSKKFFPRKGKLILVELVPHSEAAMDSGIAGMHVFARKKGKYVYEVRRPEDSNFWGTFTAGELGVKA
jgi:hypothetical protein